MPGANSNPNTPPKPGAEEQNPESQTPPVDQAEEGDAENDAELEAFQDPKKALEEIKRLRGENASRRTKSKDLETKVNAMTARLDKMKKVFGGEEGEEVDPETRMAELKSRSEQLEVEASISHLARVYEVPLEHDDYFRFLIHNKFSTLKEGEEIGDDQMAEVIAKVKSISAGPKKPGTGLPGGNKPPPDNGAGNMTVEEFKKLGTLDKSALYAKNPAQYEKLRSEAAAKK